MTDLSEIAYHSILLSSMPIQTQKLLTGHDNSDLLNVPAIRFQIRRDTFSRNLALIGMNKEGGC